MQGRFWGLCLDLFNRGRDVTYRFLISWPSLCLLVLYPRRFPLFSDPSMEYSVLAIDFNF